MNKLAYYKGQVLTNLSNEKINYKAYYKDNCIFGWFASTGDTPIVIEHPYNEIWYTTTNNAALTPNTYNFRDIGTLVSNEYSNGKGILTFASDVLRVGGYSFSGNTTLKTIEFPDTVFALDSYIFKGCTSLSDVTLGTSFQQVGLYTFSGCTSLSSVTTNATIVPSLSYANAFKGVKQNGKITYPNGADYASTNWLNNSSAYYPKYYNWSGNTTGDSTSVLSARLTLNNSSTTNFSYVGGIIPASAYTSYSATCVSAELVSATTVNTFAFRSLTAMTSVTLNNGLHSIDSNAFYNCNKISALTIPNSVVYLRNYAFQSCSNLKSITIGSGVRLMGNDVNFKNARSVFGNCYNIEAITVNPNNEIFDSRDNCNAIIKTSNNTLVLGSLTATIPNTVTSIGYQAFQGFQISAITIPSSVTSIADSAFAVTKLSAITIPNSVTSIGSYAFNYCPMSSFTYNGTVEQWANVSCGEFWDIDHWTTNVVHCTNGDVCLFSCRGIANNQVKYTTTNGQTTTPYSSNCTLTANTYTDGVGTMDFDCDIESIGEYNSVFFKGNTSLISVILPDATNSIEDNAFGGCTSLESIEFGYPYGVSIMANALSGCTSLTDIYFYVNDDAYCDLSDTQTNLRRGGTIHVPSTFEEPYMFSLFTDEFGWTVEQDL